MDSITIKLIVLQTILPFDVIREINSYLKYQQITNKNIKQIINLWFENNEQCKFFYGHISYWNTIKVTNMNELFYRQTSFNEDISRWNTSNVTTMTSMF